MFCSECGQEASGKFCSSCGQRLQPPETIEESTTDPVAVDWTTITDYATLIGIYEVRARLAHHAGLSNKKLSGEEFLEACDKFLTPLTGGVPFTLIAKLTQPLSTRLGLKTGSTRAERLAEPTGTVIVAVLCALAQNGHTLGDVTQLPAGCTLRAAAPSDIWSFQGELHVDVRAEGATTVVEAAYTVPGQLFDWGKSRRGLDQLFADVALLAKVA
jgi:hypothetical protein